MHRPVELEEIRPYFKALSDIKRLQLVEQLATHGEVRVTDLTEALDISQPLLSWHLRRLRQAGLVNTRREGREVLCSLDRTALRRGEAAFHRLTRRWLDAPGPASQPADVKIAFPSNSRRTSQ